MVTTFGGCGMYEVLIISYCTTTTNNSPFYR